MFDLTRAMRNVISDPYIARLTNGMGWSANPSPIHHGFPVAALFSGVPAMADGVKLIHAGLCLLQRARAASNYVKTERPFIATLHAIDSEF